MKACAQFASFTENISRMFAAAEKETTGGDGDTSKTNKAVEHFEKYESYFSANLLKLVDTLNLLAATETVAFLGLCARLSTASEGLSGAGVLTQAGG